jgi:hypothetical protein
VWRSAKRGSRFEKGAVSFQPSAFSNLLLPCASLRWLNANRRVQFAAVVERAAFHHETAAADVADALDRISLY